MGYKIRELDRNAISIECEVKSFNWLFMKFISNAKFTVWSIPNVSPLYVPLSCLI